MIMVTLYFFDAHTHTFFFSSFFLFFLSAFKGLFIPADQSFLEKDKPLSFYKGLPYMKYIEYRHRELSIKSTDGNSDSSQLLEEAEKRMKEVVSRGKLQASSVAHMTFALFSQLAPPPPPHLPLIQKKSYC